MHFDTLIFILLIAMAAFLRLLSVAGDAKKKSQKPGERSTAAPPPIPRAPAESDEERIRKFLEALGQPTGSSPPPPVTPRTDIPPRPLSPIQPAPAMRPFSVPHRGLTPEERRESVVILHETPSDTRGEWLGKLNRPGEVAKPSTKRVFVPKVAEAPVFEVQERQAQGERPAAVKSAAETYVIATPPKTDTARSEINITVLLQSSSGLRNAIILREIFGPPRSLQPLDLAGSA